ncbi:hypothetical protein [Streptomyces sp. B15]|uniref:hypothetical protein n=1 Tax=Streptomyces sp. B15 TaxID=1537797 RepID=UPI001B35C05B|nr:hypothetical protein [Streptomyces sp. B15]MBQ1122979.1 hypothetical protein [Streptomyces sp. B15]
MESSVQAEVVEQFGHAPVVVALRRLVQQLPCGWWDSSLGGGMGQPAEDLPHPKRVSDPQCGPEQRGDERFGDVGVEGRQEQ